MTTMPCRISDERVPNDPQDAKDVRPEDIEIIANGLELAESDQDWHEQLTDCVGDAFFAREPRYTGIDWIDDQRKAKYLQQSRKLRALRAAWDAKDWIAFGSLIRKDMDEAYQRRAEEQL